MSWSIKSKLKQMVRSEAGTIFKDWGGRRSMVIVYPNTYHVGMSNLGVHNVYRLANARSDIVCERAFLPEKAMLKEHERTNTPILSLESMRPLADFDVIAFSVAFENDFHNIKTFLEKRHPKIIVGGAVATLNPKLFNGIADEVIEGDAEKYFSPTQHLTVSPSHNTIWTPNTEFGSMHLVEIQRGCPHGCSFCAAPVIYKPFRQFPKDEIIKAIAIGLPHRKKIGLIGGDVFAHPNFSEIAEYIHSKGATFSPSSVRADRVTDEIAALLKKSGHKTITLAPEAGSEKLRGEIGKNIPDEKFFAAAEILTRHGIKQFKLYFMIGLPGETEDDLKAIKDFIRSFRRTNLQKTSISINPFVPKCGTKFEGERFAGVRDIKKKIALIKRLLAGSGTSLKFGSPLSAEDEYRLQGFTSR